MKLFFVLLCLTNMHCMFCNYYPLNDKACIQKTTGISCHFNYFENACTETKSTRLGCSSNLNLNACLQQRTKIDGSSEAKCFFTQKCLEANPFHLKMLDCDQNFSFSACMNLVDKQCAWINDRCQTYNSDIGEHDTCNEVFHYPVSPSLCAKVPILSCYNNGYSGGYICSDVTDVALSQFKCNTLGLSKAACVSIVTEKCLFQGNKCQLYVNQKITSCELYFNKALCLSITDSSILCQWTNKGCVNVNVETECGKLSNVNPSVCQMANGQCQYNQLNNSCEMITNITDLNCDNKGLSKEACMKIEKQRCIFANGQCKSLTDEDLFLFDCEQVLNELACINIRTPFQFCKWDGIKCSRIFINQDTDCSLPQIPQHPYKVNGNTCQAISKYNQGCKYNFQTNLCQTNQPATDSCTTSFLNLSGCVQIKSNIACKWDVETFSCQMAKVMDQQTKCNDLGFANAIACSQVLEPITNINGVSIKLGCYYDHETQTCKYTNENVLKSMECSQLGLNKYGCTQIIKLGQSCRWIRGICTRITRKESLAQTTCLDLQYVNAGTCALVTANQEVCKYNSIAMGCVNTLNKSIDGDSCNTPGLNVYACSQITRDFNGCYFDKENNICVLAPSSTSSDKAEQYAYSQLISTAQCVASSPTKNICIAIITEGQLCSWNSRLNRCENQYVEFNEKCLDYNTAEKQKKQVGAEININSNVCASIEMNKPGAVKTLILPEDFKGYCQYNGNGNCMIYPNKKCNSKCCTDVLGINAHVCSRYSDQSAYCYFNENNQCVELTSSDTDITSVSSVKAFYNFKQYKCSSMNENSCIMIEWSPSQQCYWDTNVCIQVNYSDYDNFLLSFQGYKLSKYGCLGIQIFNNKAYKYFRYNPDTNYCQHNILPMASCNEEQANQNTCLGKTPNNYCQWDRYSLQCLHIENYLTILTCNEYQNKKACVENPYVPCLFLDSADKCMSSPSEVNCNDFDLGKSYEGWVNEKACLNITKAGQICKLGVSAKCDIAIIGTPSTSCELPGVNSIGCYSKTTGNCIWDAEQLLCYEVDSSVIDTLKCTDNVNKQICLSIVKYPCEWSKIDLKCYMKSQFISVDITDSYNAQTCTQMTDAAYYFDETSFMCKLLTTIDNDCTSKIMNQQACLLNTKGNRCYFDANQLPENKCQLFNQEQEVCFSSLQINIEICMNLPQACYFDESTYTCKSVTLNPLIKCSSLISDTIHYNKLACSSISISLTDTSSDTPLQVCTNSPVSPTAQQCYFEKYCYWDSIVYGCKLYKIVHEQYQQGNQNSPATCSLSQILIPSCTPIYSEAVCLQFGTGCFFHISQGGCKQYTPNSYLVSACSQINGDNCTDSKTTAAYCTKELLPDGQDLTTDCSIDPPITSTCTNDTNFNKSSCSSLSSSTSAQDCAQASDNCFLKNTCTIPTSGDTITCTTPGVSQTLCLQLKYCDFSSGKCTNLTIPSLGSDNYYYVCNEVNLLTTNYLEIACASITTTPCKYQSFFCVNAFYQTCQSLMALKVSQMACNQCTNSAAAYDPNTYLCEQMTNLTIDCDLITKQTDCESKNKQCTWDSENNYCHINTQRLNKISCLQLTDKIMAKWNNELNICTTLSKSVAEQETDCTIQSIKSCLFIANTCWVSNNQCVQLNNLKKSCLDINQAKGSVNQCLISASEACQWINNQCQNASLTTDGCAVMNKYGCINIQQQITCGWSDKDKKCRQIGLITQKGCAYYVGGNEANYYQVNPYSCSQLLYANCYWNDDTNKCISVGATKLSCTKNLGLNQNACIQSTVGKCKFDTTKSTCVEITTSDITCSPLLNQEACLFLNYCQFKDNQCSDFNYKIDLVLAKIIPKGVISPQICTYYNNNLKNAYFIYDEKRKYCLNTDLDSPSTYFAQCSSIGVNEAICKQKTNQYCQYINQKCTEITIEQINLETTCNSAYNWKSCLKLIVKCKFIGGQCVPVAQTDTCLSLSTLIIALNPVFVSPRVCAQMQTPCQYNSKNYSCSLLIGLFFDCSTTGISQVGCLEQTQHSLCYFDAVNYTCSDNYNRQLTCSDPHTPKTWFINENLCYFVNSVGSYCYFDKGQCQQLPEQNVQECYTTTKTNSRTCSKAQKQICFYNPGTNRCSIDKVILQLQPWSNSNSFNKLACMSYDSNTDPRKTIWDDIEGCLELSSADLANIQCTSPINRLGCISITNPTQFCQYNIITNQCVGYDYIIPPTAPIAACILLINVNRMEFCQYAPDSCQYNSLTNNCVIATITNAQIVTPSDCFDKGLSKTTCLNISCKYSDARKLCYGGNVFCSDNTPLTCSNVKTEPCWVQNNACVGISYTDLTKVNCQDVVNKLGCTTIQTPSVICQYDQIDSQCKQITNFTNNCSNYTNVNSALACEQTIDVPCKYDYSSKACKAVEYFDVFECDRGLNQLSCTKYTRSSLECKFGKFCYGPTYGVTQCSDIINIATCMNYNFQCTWDSSLKVCIDFILNGQTCLDLQNNKTIVSSQVCYNSIVNQGVCIYDTNTNNCKFIVPKACQELETKQQCISQATLPCLWTNDRCTFVTLLSTDLCSYIGENGTKRACMDVFRYGEKCQYQNNKCQSFVELDGQSNCLDSINIIACVQQLRSKCQWKTTTTQVMSSLKDEISYNSGNCVEYIQNQQQDCDKSLSYLSCFTINKIGQYCRWFNGQCASIPLQESTVKIYYNTFTLVNSNSCGLVNQGKVIYSETTKSCIPINNENITCKCGKETPGINKFACLSIINESCLWDDVTKKCLEFQSACHKKNRLLYEILPKECFIENASVEDCQKLQIQKPCAYRNGSCIEIDLKWVNCNRQGINRFACQNNGSQQCSWNEKIKKCQYKAENNSENQFTQASKKLRLLSFYLIVLFLE